MSKGLVLVTGANGYIAAKTVEAFLEAGWSVRGTVRSLKSAKPVADALHQFADRLTFTEVPVITAPNAFDEAVKGVDVIAHLAAPVSFSFTDPEPVLRDAVEGTLRALESALTVPTLKSFVFMSSIAAIINNLPPPVTYTESSWNEFALPLVSQLGTSAPPPAIYAASKTAAERAVWKFKAEHSPKFSICAINPCFVAGPPLVVPSSLDRIGETYALMANVYLGKPLEESGISGGSSGYVDVRDVARLVIFGAENPETVDEERYIAASANSPPQAVADILRRAYPDRGVIKEGTPGVGYAEGYKFEGMVYDGSKAVKVTGKEWIPWEKTVVDTVEKLRPLLDQ